MSLKGCDGKGIYCEGLTIKKGSILIDDQHADSEYYNDIPTLHVYGGDLVMTGGTLKVTRSYQTAIKVESYTTGGEEYRGRTTPTVVHGGKIRLTGGKLVAKMRKPKTTDAIKADSISSKISLKDVNGWIDAKGATFKYGGNVYCTNHVETSRYNNDRIVKTGYADLVQYNGKSAEIIFGKKVKLDGLSYKTSGIKPGALNTKAGAKVKSITFSGSSLTLETNTFEGAKSLTSVNFESSINEVKPKAFAGAPKLKEVSFSDIYKIYSNAFTGAKSLKIIHLGYQGNIVIAANAFAGTTGLETLEFDSYQSGPFSVTRDKDDKIKSVEWSSGADISKKAFANCGKNGGKGLTVTFRYNRIEKSEAGMYRKLFISKGMPKGFKLQTKTEQ